MFLPKPKAMTMPEYAAPAGIGLDACNSGNSCSGQSCDVNGGGGSDGWSIASTVATIVGALATAAGAGS